MLRLGRSARIVGLVLPVLVGSCTVFVTPTTCERGSTSCAGIHDARFCEYVALSVEGADCAALGIAESRPFAIVSARACGATQYAVKDHDCRVLRQRPVLDGIRADSPLGTPMFVDQ